MEEPASNEQEKCPSKVELKPLLFHLRYEFLDFAHQFRIIVHVKVDGPQLEKLLDVLQKHKGVIGYSVDNIKGLSPSSCMHHIFLDASHCPS